MDEFAWGTLPRASLQVRDGEYMKERPSNNLPSVDRLPQRHPFSPHIIMATLVLSGGLIHNVFNFQVEDLGWTAVSILSLSLICIYSASVAADDSRSHHVNKPTYNYLARANDRKAEMAHAVELEQRRVRIREGWTKRGFPFKKLPPELQLHVLSFCADSPKTYCSLVLVSRYIYHSTLRGCLPCMPITLATSKQLSSFGSLVHRDISAPPTAPDNAGTFVSYLWVSPLQREDTVLAYRILRACSNVRVLACDARTLANTIAKPSKFRHSKCRDLTLLLSRFEWEDTMNTPSGRLFLEQLTHLRVMGEQTIPYRSSLPKLTHLSYLDRRRSDDEDGTRICVGDKFHTFPSLQRVVLTRRCSLEVPAPQKIDQKVVLLSIYRERTEMEVWCDSVRGQSLWCQAESAPTKS